MYTIAVTVCSIEPVGLYRAAKPREREWLQPKPFTESGEMVIGRDRGCYFYSPDNSVSGRHAIIYRNRRGVWMIRDAGSKTGTYVNGHRVQKAELIAKTQIQTGRVIWVVVSQLDEVPLIAATQRGFYKEAYKVHGLRDRAARWIGVTCKVIDRSVGLSGRITGKGLTGLAAGIALGALCSAQTKHSAPQSSPQPAAVVAPLPEPHTTPTPEAHSEAEPKVPTRGNRRKEQPGPSTPESQEMIESVRFDNIEEHSKYWSTPEPTTSDAETDH